MWTADHETTVLGGLPVLVNYAVLGADRPASWHGPAEHCEIEYEICDRRGRYAGWIERRMNDADRRALEEELWKLTEESP